MPPLPTIVIGYCPACGRAITAPLMQPNLVVAGAIRAQCVCGHGSVLAKPKTPEAPDGG